MAYLTLTNGSTGQIFGYDSNNASNLTINLVPANIKITVQTIEAALKVAQQMATAFGVDTSDTSSTTTTTSSSDTSSSTSGTTTSGSTST